MNYSLMRKILFSLPPEVAHRVALEGLRLAYYLKIPLNPPFSKGEALRDPHFSKGEVPPVKVMGLSFPNPIGLAAGLDKNGDYIEALAALGFGFIEIGTVTPKPQAGNPKPRLFRLVKENALINRLGFNNQGLDYMVERLKQTRYKGILGVNIGKNKDTPLENAIDDYLLGFRSVAPYASYVTVNISSPNTPALRDLQHGDLLESLLNTLKKEQALQDKYVPLVVKIAPDLTEAELEKIADILISQKMDGVIATNTTLSREGVENASYANEMGGLSGKPVFYRSTNVVKQLGIFLQNKVPIIGCGGVFSAQDAKDKMSAGAALVQVYTGFIYGGPGLITELTRL